MCNGIRIAAIFNTNLLQNSGGVMGLILGIIVYVVVLGGFISFGRFLKDCDTSLFEQLKTNPLNEKVVN